MAVKRLYSNVTVGGAPLDIISLEVSEGHNQTTARVSIETDDIGSALLNQLIVVDVGYYDNHGVIFRGYVDEIVESRPNGTYQIEGRDIIKRAMEHFLVSTDLEHPWSRRNISAENLVGDLLREAGITSYVGDTTHFTFGVQNDAEFNLMTSWDAINMICNILAYNCYAVDGVVYFKRIFPVPSGAPTHAFTVGNTGDMTLIEYSFNTDNLRNKVVVFGKPPIYAERSAASPYLPAGFYKTAIVSSELIEEQGMADQSADYNLQLYNKLTENLRIEAEGDYHIRCRNTISVTEPFTGMENTSWFVYSISHRIDNNGYKISLSLTR